MIKNVIFDIGMVLADFRYEAYMRDDLGFDEKTIRVFKERIVESPLWNEIDRSAIPLDDVVSEMKSRVPEYHDEAENFFSHVTGLIASYDYSRPWLEELKAKGYRVYLLSNYSKDYFELHRKSKFTFVDLADGMVISGFEKINKPEPEIYKILLNRYSLIPEECIFMDDREVNVEAAKKLRINAFVFKSYEDARAKLDTLLSL
ncbi:MAG: HAD family phosphatase [Lachnospiraceae bacterium]|nr:HAD family phosphatase [Lachnospiraceae bacterium]